MSQQARQPRRLRLVQAAVAGTLLLPTLSACGSSSQYANCIDRNGNVVADYYCDSPTYYGGGGYFIFLSSNRYLSGSRVDYGSGSRINPGDSTARANAGLPRSGKVGGSVIKSGGIGKGGTGSNTSGS